MRDPLLDQNNAYLTAYRRKCDAARKEAEGITDAEAIISGLAEWCRDVLFNTHLIETENDSHGLSEFLTLSPVHSPLQAFQRIPDAARRQTLKDGFTALMEGSENDQRDILAWLFGQALAKSLVGELETGNESTKHLLPGLWNLVKHQDLVYCALEESLRERLHNSPLARSAILSGLEKQISDINANPGIGTLYTKDQEAFNTFVDAWSSSSSIDKLWKAQEGLFPVHYDMLDIIPGILPTDRAAILDQLDCFNFLHPIRQVLTHNTILHDRDEIVATLKDAPLCSEDGQFWNGKLLALLVLQTVEDHCHDLWQAMCQAENANDTDSQIRETTKTTLALWFEELGHIVMDRSDGQFLGPQWLLMKVMDERQDRTRYGHTKDQLHRHLPQRDLIEWIALGLSKAGLTAGMIAPLVDFPDIPAPDELAPANPTSHDDETAYSRLGALYMMSMVNHMIGNASVENRQQLLGLLDALLASRDPAFKVEALLDSGARDLPAIYCGYLLANEEDPAKRWRQSWNRLIEQRRRAQHWNQTDAADALAPSLFLLAVGTAGIDCLLSSPPGRKAKELWRELFDGARECWLTISLTHLGERIETHIGRLFARHPMVFNDSVSQGDASEPNMAHDANTYSERLVQDLDLLGGDDLMLVICCLNASYNGATPAVIDEVLKHNSGHFDTILRQFKRWQELERPVRKRPEIVEALDKLWEEIEAIGDDFARNDTECC